MRNPFKKRTPEYTGTCRVREYTGGGHYAGDCFYATYDGACPRHGDVSEHLGNSEMYRIYNESDYPWPRDFELPKWDGIPWAEELRRTITDARPEGECPRGTPGCTYADCSNAWGKSCSGPDAPRHVDMGD